MTVSDNLALASGGTGGGLYTNGGESTVKNCIFFGNATPNNTSVQGSTPPIGFQDFKLANGVLNISYTSTAAFSYQALLNSYDDNGQRASMANEGMGVLYDTDPMFNC